MESPELSVDYISDWWFKDDQDNDFALKLKVDDNSSLEELELEGEYWMHELRASSIDGAHKRAIMSAIRWITTLMEHVD